MTTRTAYGLNLDLIKEKLAWKKEQAQGRAESLFDVFDQPLSEQEEQLLQFLYAYMPLHDLADYDGAFFLQHIRQVLQVQAEMPWGSHIPADIFVNYVLPYRVNNENIDQSRSVIYKELADRVQHLSMTNAILETNYWCHERATYIGTDIRTVSPLTIMRTALGRCGEQSTLTVTALRSIGIPARQCYTPRWAHCDSNHAWVEAWADGKWHFLGACEPEPILDEGWFRLPAKRAMLVHTRVFADYNGPEEVTTTHPWYTEINLLDHYASVKSIHVDTVNEAGEPVVAEVQFQLYNSAEFYPLTSLMTDDHGRASLTTGYGDLLIHARTSSSWGTAFIDTRHSSEFKVVLKYQTQSAYTSSLTTEKNKALFTEEWKMTPPVAPAIDSGIKLDEPIIEQHTQRIKAGTAIRTAFEQTFVDQEQAQHDAEAWQLPVDRVGHILQTAKGNGQEIATFINECSASERELGLRLLESLRPKDLTDTCRAVLQDHLQGALLLNQPTEDMAKDWDAYVLCPRVHFEMLTPYRAYFSKQWSKVQQDQFRSDPMQLAAVLEQELIINDDVDRYTGMATPAKAHQLGTTDSVSRDIVFVAAARSLGIFARLEPLNAMPQYQMQGIWHSVQWSKDQSISEETDTLTSSASNTGNIIFTRPVDSSEVVAEYQHNFTVAILEKGHYRTLDIPYGEKDVYDQPYTVLAGEYRLTTGTRLEDGSVLGTFVYFTVEPEQEVAVELVFRTEQQPIPILLEKLPENLQHQLHNVQTKNTAVDVTSGSILAWLKPEREPTKHLLRELAELRVELESWTGDICLLIADPSEQAVVTLDPLPAQSHIEIDPHHQSLSQWSELLPSLNGDQLPVVIVVDQQNRVRYSLQGYKLGTGKELLRVVHQMNPEG